MNIWINIGIKYTDKLKYNLDLNNCNLQNFTIHFDTFATRNSKDYLIINDDSGMGKLKYFGNTVPPDYVIRSEFCFCNLCDYYCTQGKESKFTC